MPSFSRLLARRRATRGANRIGQVTLLALAALLCTAGVALAMTAGSGDSGPVRAAVYTTNTTAAAPPPPPPPAPPVPPPDKAYAGTALAGKSVTVQSGSVSLTLSSSENSSGNVSLASAKRVQTSAKGKIVKLGSKSFTLVAGKPTVVKIKISRKGLKAFKRGKLSAKATITARDAAGNQKVTTKTLTLKLAKAKRK